MLSFIGDKRIADTITVVPNGVDLNVFRPAPLTLQESEALQSRWGLEGKQVIVSISRLVPKNGLDDLIRAMPAVLESAPSAALLLVGEGGDL